MKPNHNIRSSTVRNPVVVYTMSKIQNETKSQHRIILYFTFMGCLYYVKDTK